MPQITLYEFSKPVKLPFSQKKLRAFKTYLDEIWHNRLWFDENEKNGSQPFLQFDGTTIRAKNYVGYLYFEDLEIHILPKIFSKQRKPDKNLIFRHLAYYLSYSDKLHFPFFSAENNSFTTDKLQDFWLFVFVSLTEQCLNAEPFRRFEEIAEESTYLRGRIDMPEYINQSLSKGEWQQIHTVHEPFVYDNLFNRIIKYTLEKVRQITSEKLIEDKLNQLDFILNEVSNQFCTIQDCQKIHLNQGKEKHRVLLDFCKLILLNEQINNDLGTNNNFTFLFPMEQVFEDFVFGFIKEHFPELEAQSQSTDYLAQTKVEGKSVFQVRNDIFLPSQNKIIDTKYKLRTFPFENEKTGVDQSDMYQMLSYGIARTCQQLILLYPAQFNEKCIEQKQSEFIIQSELLGNQTMSVQTIDVDICVNRLRDMKTELDQKIYRQIKKSLM